MEVRFRPLLVWPHPVTENRRHHPFRRGGRYVDRYDGAREFVPGGRTSWSTTLADLTRELGYLGADVVLIGAGFTERDIRVDGWPKSNARALHPGVEISFDSRFGRLTYATDVCDEYVDNVRSIALGLEALRAVDRYGVSTRGQQYAGWKALPTGSNDPKTVAEARVVLLNAAGLGNEGPMITARYTNSDLYRMAVKRVHPDTGGNEEAFKRVQAAKRVLEAVA